MSNIHHKKLVSVPIDRLIFAQLHKPIFFIEPGFSAHNIEFLITQRRHIGCRLPDHPFQPLCRTPRPSRPHRRRRPVPTPETYSLSFSPPGKAPPSTSSFQPPQWSPPSADALVSSNEILPSILTFFQQGRGDPYPRITAPSSIFASPSLTLASVSSNPSFVCSPDFISLQATTPSLISSSPRNTTKGTPILSA